MLESAVRTNSVPFRNIFVVWALNLSHTAGTNITMHIITTWVQQQSLLHMYM